MKAFHLSDLHLGKRIYEFSMLEEQRHILDEILGMADDERPDVVLVAGDIFDRTIPSEEAILLWDDFLNHLCDRQIPVCAISGNHDSAVRFSSHRRLMEPSGIHFSAVYDGHIPVCTLQDDYGPVHIHLLPYIRPAEVRAIYPEAEISDYNDAVRTAIAQLSLKRKERNILVAHQFVTGATRCESEEIIVGGLDNVDAAVFNRFDYVALGHIHGRQHIRRDTIRYCGTPLKYSFSEQNHVKSVTVVELGEKGKVSIRELPLTPLHDMREIRGTYDELMQAAPRDPAPADYIHAILTDENDIPDAVMKLRVVYPNLMKLSYDNLRTRITQTIDAAAHAEARTPMELFEELYEKQNNQPLTGIQRAYVMDCIRAVWEEE